MSLAIAGETTTDPRDLRRHHASFAEGMGIGLGTGHRNGMTDAKGGARGRRTQGIDGIEAQARGPAARTKTSQICQCRDGSREMCQKCRYLSLRRLIGRWPSYSHPAYLVLTVLRNFIFHVENSFRNRGLRVDVLVLGPRIPLNAAVQRQIVEGVLAVVRLSRPNQFSRKIPLQIFDRRSGPDKVHFNGKSNWNSLQNRHY